MASQEGLLPFKLIEDDSGEALTSFGGLPLVVETCQALGLPGLVKRHVRIKRRDIGYTESKYMESVIALIPAGGDCLEDIEQLQSDAVLKLLLGDRGYGRGVRRSKGKRDLEVTSEQAPGLLGSQIS
ncbi:MAG: transposase [Deltaproteobacteria bacterium]|nr:transposase [Deltaproteobacteria bacterium]